MHTPTLNRRRRPLTVCLLLAAALLLPLTAGAHGVAGKRLFPTTFQVEDPFVSDEASLLFNHIKGPEGKVSEVGLELAKRITPRLGLSVGEAFRWIDPAEGGSSVRGLGNLELGAKYQLLTRAEHETILSLGTTLEVGGSGARRVGADSFSTVSPTLFFGKGMGDLPEALQSLRPLALTGVIGANIPTRRTTVTVDPLSGDSEVERNPTTLTWGISLQYSLLYLQSYVKDLGLGAPFNRMILVAELPMETCLSSGCDGQTSGSFNPGLVWAGKTVELGLAAQIPINQRSGKNVGVLALFHLFLDDLLPKGLGGPLFP